jgi:hypothetical protein
VTTTAGAEIAVPKFVTVNVLATLSKLQGFNLITLFACGPSTTA